MTASRARKTLLEAARDLMSCYMAEECPEDENWEDFDLDIDQLRTEVDDLLERRTLHVAAMSELIGIVW